MMKISYISLGCAKNQVDLEYLIGRVNAIGLQIEADPKKCDFVLINTCGFIESAVRESIDNILLMSGTIKKSAKIIVMGCMAERYIADLKSEMPEIDFISGVGKPEEVLDYLKSAPGAKTAVREPRRVITNYPYFAYIKIAEGCNNRCSYCTIPSIRGGLKSRSVDDILLEVEMLIGDGVKELIIVSQDTTKYGIDFAGSSQLVPLLNELTGRFPSTLFRLLYLNPDGVTEELIDIMAEKDNIIKYFEIPVQHASDKILKSMNRKSDNKKICDVFSMIRGKIPGSFIRTTFIIGFPGESDEDFDALCGFITDMKPDFAGFFPYSREDGTKAALMDGIIPEKIVRARIKKCESLQKKNTAAKMKLIKKETFQCFIEKPNDDFDFILEGRAIFQAPDIDGKLYVTDGVATDGYGPYDCVINKIAYPDIYVTLKQRGLNIDA